MEKKLSFTKQIHPQIFPQILLQIFLQMLVVLAFGICIQKVDVVAAEATTLENTETTIYGVGSTNKDKVTIPSDYPTTYKIPYVQNATYKVTSGSSVKVSSTGLVTPKYTYYKSYGSYYIAVSEGSAYDYYALNTGASKVTVTSGGQTYTYTIEVKDYSSIYCQQVIADYLDTNIMDGMTDSEVINVICRMPAMYDYSPYYYTAYGMILNGGGDCWASTYLIIKECEYLGIKAWVRNGNRDSGAGSGHMNAMVEYNGVYYELEAGYAMAKSNGYRPYTVKVRESLFSYRISSNNKVTIYQYDGYDKTGTLEIPETIADYPVVALEKSAFSSTNFTQIILPDTMVTIGDFAFNGCKKLEKIHIPASVTSLGNGVFGQCNSLTSLTIDSDNPAYQVINDVIYNKAVTNLVSCPNASTVSIPNTVNSIQDYAFYYNNKISKIEIPSNVKTIEEGAFGGCSVLKTVRFANDSVEFIANFAFSECKLSAITLPASLESVGANVFNDTNTLRSVYFKGQAPSFEIAIGTTTYDRFFYGLSGITAYYIPDETWTSNALSAHGGTNVTWEEWEGSAKRSLGEATITLARSSYVYDGTEKKPAVTVTYDDVTLVEGTDYEVIYQNNINAGTANVMAIGKGLYDAKQKANFSINKANQSISFMKYKTKIEIGESYQFEITGAKSDLTFTSSNEAAITIDENGVMKGVAAGSATITITAVESENYKTAKLTLTVTASADVHNMEDVDIDYATPDNNKFTLHRKCKVCGKTDEVTKTTITSFDAFYGTPSSDYYKSYVSRNQKENAIIYVLFNTYPTGVEDTSISFISSDEDVVAVNDGILTFKKAGKATVTMQATYNPEVKKSITFTVNHEYVANKEKSYPATCTEAGAAAFTCSLCNGEYSEEIPALGHKSVEIPAKSPTCTEDGLTRGEYCSVCNETLLKQEVDPAKGHSWKAAAEIDIPATCTETGSKSIHCANCEVTKDPEVVPAKGHSWDDGEITTQSTCLEKGEKTYKCKDCSETKKEDVPAKGHSWKSAAEIDIPATCTETGSKSIHCENCKATKDSEVIPVTDHAWDNGTITTQSTCLEKGEKTYKCKDCPETKKEAVPAKGHTVVIDPSVAPTPAQTGLTEGSHCSVCGQVFTKQEVIPVSVITPAQVAVDNPLSQDTSNMVGQPTETIDQIVQATRTDEINGTVYQILQLKLKKAAKTSLSITWKPVAGATSYIVYSSKCGTPFVKTAVSGTPSFTQAQLAPGTYYKYFVVAVKDNTVMTTSKVIHLATTGKKVGNNKTIKLNKKSVVLKKGKAFALKATLVAASKKLKVKKHRAVKYESSNPSIATVSANGKVVAKQKGKCIIYAYSQDGIVASAKITVK